MIHLPSACLSIVLALALAVQAQDAQESVVTPTDTTSAPPSTTPIDPTTAVEPSTTVPPTTTATPSPTTTTTTTAEPSITTTTTTDLPVITTTAITPPVTTTTPPASITTTSRDVVPPVTRPTTNHNTSISPSVILPTTSTGSNNANGGSSSSTSSTNVPAIVGGVVGVLALAVIVATSVICYKRRKRNNRELTFDTLEGMSGPALSSRKRASLNYLTSSSPVITSGNVGLNSVPSAHGGYDDNYDYEMQSNVGYPTPLQPHNNSAYHQSAYNSNAAYDGYGSPQQGYRPNPTIFQEEAPYAASSMGRGRTGFDQNLPEVMYNRGEIDHDPTAGFYQEEDIYNTAAWSQDQQHPHGGYIAEQGQWDVDAMLHQYDHEIEMPLPPAHQQVLSTPSLDSTLIGSPGRPKHQSATVHNPQAIVESPILQSATLRSGDIFGQEATGAGASLGSPRISTKQATQELEAVGGGAGRQSTSNSSSPRIINASREMRSIELASQSPTFGGPSIEAINSYATDYDQSRPSIDRTAGGAGSPSNLNANKSLRSFRREDWS